MDRGLYAAASGGLHNARRLEIVANNLANVNTVGYKAERLVSREQQFSDTLASVIAGVPLRSVGDHQRTPGVVDLKTETDFSPGPVSYTGNPLDVALREANEFFVLETEEGVAYTRAGNFTLTADGTLVSPDGSPVQGEGGPITIPPGEVKISSSGVITVDGRVVNRLRVVRFDDLSGLERRAGARFVSTSGNPQTVPANVIPASVEMANVGTVESLIEMIGTQRAFEAYTKTARTIDELNERSIRNARPSS